MSVEGTAVAILILVVFVAFYANNINDLLTAQIQNLQAQQQKQNAANGLAPSPQKGEVICNLQVTIYPYITASAFQLVTLDQSFLGQDPSVVQPNPYHTPVSYQWLACHVYATPTLADLIPQVPYQLANPHLMDFITAPASQQVTYDISMVGDDGTLLSQDTSGYSNYLERSFVVPAGVVNIPFTKVLNYYIPNVARQNYNLLITSNLSINGMPAGSPFAFEMCADLSGTTTITCQSK